MQRTKGTGTEDDLVVSRAGAPGGGAYVRTFGAFLPLRERRRVKFELRKCKEFLAYLVDKRGAVVPMSEMIAVLCRVIPKTRRSCFTGTQNAACVCCFAGWGWTTRSS